MKPLLGLKNKMFSSWSLGVTNRSLIWAVVLKTGVSGFLISLVVLVSGHEGLSLGIFLGCLAAAFNFLGLNSLTHPERPSKSRHLFWVWNMVRWVGLIVTCGLFRFISTQCFWGGLAGYLWFLFILIWTGMRGSLPETQPRGHHF